MDPSEFIGKDLALGRKLDYNLYRDYHVEADDKYLATDTPFRRGLGYIALQDPSGVAHRNEIQGQFIDYSKLKMPPAPGKNKGGRKKSKAATRVTNYKQNRKYRKTRGSSKTRRSSKTRGSSKNRRKSSKTRRLTKN